MITFAIHQAFKKAKVKGWNKIYIGVDLHGVVIYPDYSKVDKSKLEYYPLAKQVLKTLSERKDVVLIMYTCSWPSEIEKYREFFGEDNINFEYVNENPEVDNTRYGYYRDKPYFDILLEDKAGFDASKEWVEVKLTLDTFYKEGILNTK